MSSSSVATLCSFGGGLRTSRGSCKGSCGGVSTGNASPMFCWMEESEKTFVRRICTSSGRLQPRSMFSFNHVFQLASSSRSLVMHAIVASGADHLHAGVARRGQDDVRCARDPAQERQRRDHVRLKRVTPEHQ